MLTSQLVLLACVWARLTGAVTIYGVKSAKTIPTSQAHAAVATLAAYDQTVLTSPSPPSPAITNNFLVQLYPGTMPGMSIKQSGSFLGFSIELSVVQQTLGKNSTHLQVPFLNYMANLRARGGAVSIRVGGNSQDQAYLVSSDSIPNYGVVSKQKQAGATTPTETPDVVFSSDLLTMMKNIGDLVDANFYFGLNFFNPDNETNAVLVAQTAEKILGDRLLGFQLGNEPDLYGPHGRRNSSYSMENYMNDYQTMINDLNGASLTNNQILIGPSTCCNWNETELFNLGYLTTYAANLKMVAIQRYPSDNCKINGNVHDPQQTFSSYIGHNTITSLTAQYITSSQMVQAAGKPFVLMETNTASCGGFPGISDSFAATMWAADLGLQFAFINFSQVLLHVGGQDTYYNPFTPPPTNLSNSFGWTTGAIYYSSLLIAEAFGKTGNAQVVDLYSNSNNDNTPGYAIYEDGNPVRVVLFNYIDDSTGANDYTANIAIGGQQTGQASTTPTSVQVRYMRAPSLGSHNVTWAGQNLGGELGSDGRLQGTQETVTIQCDTTAQTCAIPVKAPSIALVFLTDTALTESSPDSTMTQTFPTSAVTNKPNKITISVDPSVLSTSNGRGGAGNNLLGSTSEGSLNSAPARMQAGAAAISATFVALSAAFFLISTGVFTR
ncbi:glycoside hydrolase family 79 protein [Rhizoctonia solani AG-3 Rhs1AP]|uniref:Glycoside hydrolase family 79 protein n=1 Tax=Rhizoctonia solani AG-3 Rhs1AP TaxID=1086054 RepID=X8JL52_9AGAM|nr:glycoside hydrolase family 79 protein [Rhizoctonia solani AG-3 Rhs1AP]